MYFGNMIVRDSTFVFINMEFDLNIRDEQLRAASTAKPPPQLKQVYIVAPFWTSC